MPLYRRGRREFGENEHQQKENPSGCSPGGARQEVTQPGANACPSFFWHESCFGFFHQPIPRGSFHRRKRFHRCKAGVRFEGKHNHPWGEE